MSEAAVKKILRRIKNSSANLLDSESFNVAEARGKLANIVDFTCFDKGVIKLVKVCYKSISKKEIENLLQYNDSQLNATTILQIDFWSKNSHKPFYRSKLFYGKPNQPLCEELKRLIN